MNKIVVLLVAIGLFCLAIKANAAPEDQAIISKFCFDKFCLGDPALKFGGIKSFKAYNFLFKTVKPLPTLPVPNCDNKIFHVLLSGQNPKSPKYYEVTLASYPEYLKNGVDSYYRIQMVRAVYPRIAQEDTKPLAKKIFDRAGVEGKEGFPLLTPGLQWRPTENTRFGGIDITGVTVTVNDEDAFLMLSEGINFKQRTEQDGCVSKVPSL